MNSTDPSPPQKPAEERETSDRASHLAFVAHEIRNPLATALWSAELLGRLSAQDRGGARGDKLARMCLRAILRVRRLVEDHLLAERLDAAGLPVALEAVPLSDLVPADAASIGAPELTIDLEPGALAVTDAGLARRAIEATLFAAARGGAPVRVTGRRGGAAVRIRVEGSPADPADIADRCAGEGNDQHGAVLGLGAARRAALALGGSLVVEESAFVIELPALEPERAPG